jgi:prepilin-type N-terminal cleavage/methylation domain-containing protein
MMTSQQTDTKAFTLLELLVSMAVFSILVVVMLNLTNALLSHSTRIDVNAEADRDVRVFFDFLRRDLAQARIGTNKNFFKGSTSNLYFVASTSKLKSNYVSDARLVAYQLRPDPDTNNHPNRTNIYRSIIDPTNANLSASTTNWFYTNSAIVDAFSHTNTNNSEVILEGYVPFQPYPLFTYVDQYGKTLITPPDADHPPSGVVVAFGLLTKTAKQRGVTTVTGTNDANSKMFQYDIELNLPPAYDP